MNWTKVEPWAGEVHQGCLNCPPVENVAPMETLVAVGFGYAAITRDGKEVFNEMEHQRADLPLDELPSLDKFEAMAAADPDHDWRLHLEAPLRGRVYQRHDVGKWVLISSNEGFAVPAERLTLLPCELKEARAFVAEHHRHHKPPQGHRFSLKACTDGRVVGVAIVGRPVARHQQDGETLEITRLCTDGTPNAVSFLVGAVKRVGRALGYKRLISYTLIEENGASWRASGMVQTATTAGGAWSGTYGDGKKRANDHPLQEKRRWEIHL